MAVHCGLSDFDSCVGVLMGKMVAPPMSVFDSLSHRGRSYGIFGGSENL